MSLDKEVLRMDSLGIFPRSYETAEQFVERGNQFLESSTSNQMYSYALYSARITDHCNKLYLPGVDDNLLIKKAAAKVNKRFNCDLSWVPAYYGNLGDLILFGGRGGVAFGSLDTGTKSKTYISPFIVLNSFQMTRAGELKSAMHELVHIPRATAFNECITYAASRSFDEMLANFAYLSGVFKPVPDASCRTMVEYIRARAKFRRAFKQMYGYALIRVPYEEVKDFFLEGLLSEDPKKTICIKAEDGDLRYRIIKERLGL